MRAKSLKLELYMQKQAETPKIRPLLAGWIGGKSKLATAIIKRIPAHTCYAEPFAGAAWVLFRKAPSKVEVLNDINRDIVNLYRLVQSAPGDFIRRFEYALHSRAIFEAYLHVNPDTLSDEERAIRFYYILQSSFGGKVAGASFGTSKAQASRLNIPALQERVKAVHARLARVCLECLPYHELIRRYNGPETFFYLDPPYWNCENDYGKGIFSKKDFATLAEQLAGIQGKFLLSLNDKPEVRHIFSCFNLEPVQTSYTMGTRHQLRASELFITNY